MGGPFHQASADDADIAQNVLGRGARAMGPLLPGELTVHKVVVEVEECQRLESVCACLLEQPVQGRLVIARPPRPAMTV